MNVVHLLLRCNRYTRDVLKIEGVYASKGEAQGVCDKKNERIAKYDLRNGDSGTMYEIETKRIKK